MRGRVRVWPSWKVMVKHFSSTVRFSVSPVPLSVLQATGQHHNHNHNHGQGSDSLCYWICCKGAAALLAVGDEILAAPLQALHGVLHGGILGLDQVLLGTAAGIVVGVALLQFCI